MRSVHAGHSKYMIPMELLCPCSFPGIAEGNEPSQKRQHHLILLSLILIFSNCFLDTRH